MWTLLKREITKRNLRKAEEHPQVPVGQQQQQLCPFLSASPAPPYDCSAEPIKPAVDASTYSPCSNPDPSLMMTALGHLHLRLGLAYLLLLLLLLHQVNRLADRHRRRWASLP